MKRIRVLVVDDAVVIRKILTDILAADPAIEVIATAPNGRIALAKIAQLQPDLVTLDVEMPEMDGIETLKALRATNRRLPVIMFSTLTERGAAKTMEALLAGANDYVTKPANVGSITAAMEKVTEDLLPKIKALSGYEAVPPPAMSRPVRPASMTGGSPAAAPFAAGTLAPRVDVVAIGVSTGGPNALAELLPALPGNLPVPILLVQHMPPTFTRYLAERLDAQAALRIAEADGGETPKAGEVWIAPGGRHLIVRREGTAIRLRTTEGPPENSCRPAVDVLFRSVAAVYGRSALGVVLTGMGYDGRRGSQDLRDAGGQVIAQDQASSVVWGMPGAVVNAGLADRVAPLDRIGNEITRMVQAHRLAQPVGGRTP